MISRMVFRTKKRRPRSPFVGCAARGPQPLRAATFLATAALVVAFFATTFLAAVPALRELCADTTTFLTGSATLTGALPERAAVDPARVLAAADTLPAAVFGAGLATPFCEPAGLVAAASRAVSFFGPRVELERSAGVLAAGSLAAAFFAAGFLSAALRPGVSSSATALAALARFFGAGAGSSSSSSSSKPSDAFTRPPDRVLSLMA